MYKHPYIKWIVAGIPIMFINYIMNKIVFHFTHNNDLAYWSWILIAPFTYHIWRFIESGIVVKEKNESKEKNISSKSC